MHPQAFDIARIEANLRRTHLFETFDPVIIGLDHNLDPYHQEKHAFGLFPELPRELQFMIWAAAADERQIVRIRSWLEEDTGTERFFGDYTMPVVLHVCHDSREEALKRYSVIFTGILRDPIYFNYQRDFLSLVGLSAYEHFQILSQEDWIISAEILQIENVLSVVNGLGSGESEEDVLLKELAIWGQVKRIIIAERLPTWCGTFKEIWSDSSMESLVRATNDNNTSPYREDLVPSKHPQVRIVKFNDVLNAVAKNERQSL